MRVLPPGAQTSPAEPSTRAGCAPLARPKKVAATAAAPRTSLAAPTRTAAPSERSTTSGSSNASRASSSPPREAARKASTTSRWRVWLPPLTAVPPCTRRRPRLASCLAAAGVRSTIGAISSKGRSNRSCSTNATRSAGESVSSTSSSASPIESASSASCSGSEPAAWVAAGSGTSGPSGTWAVKAFKGSSSNCGTATFPASPIVTSSFDVARAVIVGAVESGGIGGDTYVREDQAANNFGAATDVEVNPNAGHRKHALVGFDLSGAGISGSVTSATLRLRLRDGANLPRTDDVYRATSTWGESAVTWITSPTVAAGASATIAAPACDTMVGVRRARRKPPARFRAPTG